MELNLTEFDSRLTFVRVNYRDDEGMEVIAFNIRSGLTLDTLEDGDLTNDALTLTLGKLSKRIESSLPDGRFDISAVPYTQYQTDVVKTGFIITTEDGGSIALAWNPIVSAYTPKKILGIETETKYTVPTVVKYEDAFTMTVSEITEHLTWTMEPTNEYIGWELTISELTDEGGYDYLVVVSYDVADDRVCRIMQLNTSSVWLAQNMIGLESLGERNLKVHAMVEYLEVEPINVETNEFKVEATCELQLGIVKSIALAEIQRNDNNLTVTKNLACPEVTNLTLLERDINNILRAGLLIV